MPSRAATSDPIRLLVARSEPGARTAFDVPRDNVLVLLDALAMAAAADPSLFFRFSCRSGFCGTCTVLRDGAPVLACQSRLGPDARTVRVAPLGGFPVVRDLVVDHAPFAERWRAVDPARTPSDPDADPTTMPAVTESLDCISCGACFAACDLSSAGALFLGPAALTRASVLEADPRYAPADRRLDLVAGPGGVDGCRGMGACSLACPRQLDPSRAIRRLRRRRRPGSPAPAAAGQ